MPFFTELSQLALKVEGTEGTDSTPAAADATLIVRNGTWDAEVPKFTRDLRHNSFSRIQGVMGTRAGTYSGEFDMYSAVAAGVDNVWAPLFKACGWAASGLSGTAVTYKLSSGTASYTLADYINNGSAAYLSKLIGARGNLELRAEAGGTLVCGFDLMGAYVAPADSSMLSITYETGDEYKTPPRFAGVAFTFAAGTLSSTEAILRSVRFNTGNIIEPRYDASTGTNGIISYAITGRHPEGEFEIELPTVAAWDAYGTLIAGTVGNITFTVGSGAGVALPFTIIAQLKSVKRTNANGLMRITCAYDAVPSAAGLSDEITLAIV